ncbi:MAG: hypothetical protein Q8S24_03100 [Eubacteriales bacterium]|nr:hypothetical protein [Eubacteriales bacterium]
MKRLASIALFISIILISGCNTNELEILKTEYRAQFNEMYILGEPQLIDSYEKWQLFLESHPEQSNNEDNFGWDLEELFFEESVIYAYISNESSGSNRFEAEKAEVSDNILRLYMTRTVPETGTDDLATRICFFGIKNADIQNIKSVEAIINVKR